jgi:hypothetical protein
MSSERAVDALDLGGRPRLSEMYLLRGCTAVAHDVKERTKDPAEKNYPPYLVRSLLAPLPKGC